MADHANTLRRGILSYLKGKPRLSSKLATLVLPGQPFDALFLAKSRLFRHSRRTFLTQGGKFEATLVTTPRSLSSPILLENRIQYSPIEAELFWAATDREQMKDKSHLYAIITYVTSTFHEQNHRILWKLLPKPADLSESGIRRYLNFTESLVVALDMALGDELGPALSSFGFLSGALYDPGSTVKFKNERERRSYLQAVVRATYLSLEFHRRDEVLASIPSRFPELPRILALHAASRALRLDERFVAITNPTWQEKNWKRVAKALKPKKGEKVLTMDRDPNQFLEPYVWAERVLDRFL